MYDRRLEAVVAAAELGSFSKAAAKLHLSTPSLAKQIDTFEAEHGIALFERSHHGVSLTPAGVSLVEDARAVMRLSSDSLRRARECSSGTDGTVRLGVSMLCPARKTLDAWPHIHSIDPSLKMELVPVGDLYDDRLALFATWAPTSTSFRRRIRQSDGEDCARLCPWVARLLPLTFRA